MVSHVVGTACDHCFYTWLYNIIRNTLWGWQGGIDDSVPPSACKRRDIEIEILRIHIEHDVNIRAFRTILLFREAA